MARKRMKSSDVGHKAQRRSKYDRHQGAHEIARRLHQIRIGKPPMPVSPQ